MNSILQSYIIAPIVLSLVKLGRTKVARYTIALQIHSILHLFFTITQSANNDLYFATFVPDSASVAIHDRFPIP